MDDQDQASTEPTSDGVLDPVPVPPSRETERPAGLAFDVEKGADLPGVPTGDQTPKNPGAAPAQEMGGGIGLALPRDQARKEEQAAPEALPSPSMYGSSRALPAPFLTLPLTVWALFFALSAALTAATSSRYTAGHARQLPTENRS